MKFNCLLLILLLFACENPSTEKKTSAPEVDPTSEESPAAFEISDFSGHWKWKENQEGKHIFELVLEQKDSLVNGYICAIAETGDGQRIDCGYGDGYAKYNLMGSVKENVLTAKITGAFSKQSGKVMVIRNQDHLRWTILENPGEDYMQDYFFPNEAVLLPDDRTVLRKIPYRKDYSWENTSPVTKTADFSGKWMLTDFLDSTLLQKKVMPFISFPNNRYTHFMTILDFSTFPEGKLRIVSDIEDGYIPVIQTDDSTLLFEFNPYTYRLEKTPDTKLLKLTAFQKNVQYPLKTFFYRPAPEQFAEFAGNAPDLHFNKILEGQYQVLKGDRATGEVKFGPEKSLSGLGNYDSYRVHWIVEAGTPEVDAVQLFDSAINEARYFHFRFAGKTLFLYNLKKTADPESGFYTYKIAEEIFQLKKIK